MLLRGTVTNIYPGTTQYKSRAGATRQCKGL